MLHKESYPVYLREQEGAKGEASKQGVRIPTTAQEMLLVLLCCHQTRRAASASWRNTSKTPLRDTRVYNKEFTKMCHVQKPLRLITSAACGTKLANKE
jgi:hypothetical protein